MVSQLITLCKFKNRSLFNDKNNKFDIESFTTKVKDLISQGEDINELDTENHNAFYYMSFDSHYNFNKDLFEFGISVGGDINKMQGSDTMFGLIVDRYQFIMQLAKEKNPELIIDENFYFDMIRYCVNVGHGNVTIKRGFEKKSIFKFIVENYHRTGIHKNVDMFKFLVNAGGDIYENMYHNLNLISYLCGDYVVDMFDIIKYCIESLNFKINDPNKHGVTAFMVLCNNSRRLTLDIFKYFVETGGDFNVKDNDGNNAFMILCNAYFDVDIMNYALGLCSHLLNEPNQYKETPFYALCFNRHTNRELIDLCLEKGANLNVISIRDNIGGGYCTGSDFPSKIKETPLYCGLCLNSAVNGLDLDMLKMFENIEFNLDFTEKIVSQCYGFYEQTTTPFIELCKHAKKMDYNMLEYCLKHKADKNKTQKIVVGRYQYAEKSAIDYLKKREFNV